MARSAQPHSVDVHVGAKIRLRRKMLGVSQTELADAVGLTFQQIQKYERGTNRVSASKLFDFARKLDVPISYFFDDLPDTTTGGDRPVLPNTLAQLGTTSEGLRLAELFQQVPVAERRLVLKLVQALAARSDRS